MNPTTLDTVPEDQSAFYGGSRIRISSTRIIETLARWRFRRDTGGQVAQLPGDLLRDIGKTRIEAEYGLDNRI